MGIAQKKIELIQEISALDDLAIVDNIKAILDQSKETEPLTLNQEDILSIQKGLDQLNVGQGISLEDFYAKMF